MYTLVLLYNLHLRVSFSNCPALQPKTSRNTLVIGQHGFSTCIQEEHIPWPTMTALNKMCLKEAVAEFGLCFGGLRDV